VAEGTVYGEPRSTVVDTHAVVDEATVADKIYNRTMLSKCLKIESERNISIESQQLFSRLNGGRRSV
jgi:hypothetical protein